MAFAAGVALKLRFGEHGKSCCGEGVPLSRAVLGWQPAAGIGTGGALGRAALWGATTVQRKQPRAPLGPPGRLDADARRYLGTPGFPDGGRGSSGGAWRAAAGAAVFETLTNAGVGFAASGRGRFRRAARTLRLVPGWQHGSGSAPAHALRRALDSWADAAARPPMQKLLQPQGSSTARSFRPFATSGVFEDAEQVFRYRRRESLHDARPADREKGRHRIGHGPREAAETVRDRKS